MAEFHGNWGRAVRHGLVVTAFLGISLAARAADTPQSSDLPDLSAIRAKIYSGQYEAAVADLLPLSETVKHADVFNLLGYSLRNLGRYDEAEAWYEKALWYDGSHRPTLEYQGELFISIGRLDRARANLSLLKVYCPEGCHELDLLTRKIAEAEASARSGS